MTYEFDATVYVWQARRADTWTFVDLPEPLADEILEAGARATRGFGSLRVDVTVGTTSWRTSIFPSDATFVLPVKKAVRHAEDIGVGDRVHVRVTLVDV